MIAIPPNIEKRLREFAAAYPEELAGIERILKFREAALEAFNRLVRAGAAADPEEIGETESEEMVLLA